MTTAIEVTAATEVTVAMTAVVVTAAMTAAAVTAAMTAAAVTAATMATAVERNLSRVTLIAATSVEMVPADTTKAGAMRRPTAAIADEDS